MQSLKKQHIYSSENKSYHFSPENKIQIPLEAASSSTSISTSQMPKTPNYTDKLKQSEFENCEEKSELETEKPIKEPRTKPVTRSSNQSKNQEEELDIKEATFRNVQENIIFTYLRLINPPAENNDKITTPYITQLTNFSGEKKKQIGLKSSILGRVCPVHPDLLPEAVTLAKALESVKKKANHSQIVNMVIKENKTEMLEKRITQLGEKLFKKIENYLISDPGKNNTYQTPQRHNQKFSSSQNNHSLCQDFRTETHVCHFYKCIGHLISQCQMQIMQKAHKNNYYMPPQMLRNQYMLIPHQYLTMYQNQGTYQQ
ncbi:hypothetical protein G9A89_015755 [Geosiphon pyriformis]|nr:hypothetical protein G9A89_015755 [Geosiphon pyriformis]